MAKEGAQQHELDGQRIALHEEKVEITQIAQFMAVKTWMEFQRRANLPPTDDDSHENALLEQHSHDAEYGCAEYPDEWDDMFIQRNENFEIDLHEEFERGQPLQSHAQPGTATCNSEQQQQQGIPGVESQRDEATKSDASFHFGMATAASSSNGEQQQKQGIPGDGSSSGKSQGLKATKSDASFHFGMAATASSSNSELQQKQGIPGDGSSLGKSQGSKATRSDPPLHFGMAAAAASSSSSSNALASSAGHPWH